MSSIRMLENKLTATSGGSTGGATCSKPSAPGGDPTFMSAMDADYRRAVANWA